MRKFPLLTLLATACLQVAAARGEESGSGPERPLPAGGPKSVILGRSSITSVLTAPVDRGPLTFREAIGIASASRAVMSEIKDYSATFTKTERIKGRLRKQVMEMKLRAEPFSVYLRYQSKKEAGRQAIYVADRHDGNLLIQGYKGRAGALRLNPNNPFVRAENRYPVTQLGMARMIETALATWDQDAKCEGVQALVAYSSDARRGNAAGDELLVTHANPHPAIDFHRTHIVFDRETKLPVHMERYGWPEEEGEEPPLIEEYSYSNVQLNVGLTDADFELESVGR